MHGFKPPRRRNTNTLLDPEAPKLVSPENSPDKDAYAGYGHAPQRTAWNLDAQSMIEKLKSNRTFKVGGDFDTQGLPVFDDLTNEECSKRIHKVLVRNAKDRGDGKGFAGIQSSKFKVPWTLC